jgi:hypothetical protein
MLLPSEAPWDREKKRPERGTRRTRVKLRATVMDRKPDDVRGAAMWRAILLGAREAPARSGS